MSTVSTKRLQLTYKAKAPSQKTGLVDAETFYHYFYERTLILRNVTFRIDPEDISALVFISKRSLLECPKTRLFADLVQCFFPYVHVPPADADGQYRQAMRLFLHLARRRPAEADLSSLYVNGRGAAVRIGGEGVHVFPQWPLRAKMRYYPFPSATVLERNSLEELEAANIIRPYSVAEDDDNDDNSDVSIDDEDDDRDDAAHLEDLRQQLNNDDDNDVNDKAPKSAMHQRLIANRNELVQASDRMLESVQRRANRQMRVLNRERQAAEKDHDMKSIQFGNSWLRILQRSVNRVMGFLDPDSSMFVFENNDLSRSIFDPLTIDQTGIDLNHNNSADPSTADSLREWRLKIIVEQSPKERPNDSPLKKILHKTRDADGSDVYMKTLYTFSDAMGAWSIDRVGERIYFIFANRVVVLDVEDNIDYKVLVHPFSRQTFSEGMANLYVDGPLMVVLSKNRTVVQTADFRNINDNDEVVVHRYQVRTQFPGRSFSRRLQPTRNGSMLFRFAEITGHHFPQFLARHLPWQQTMRPKNVK